MATIPAVPPKSPIVTDPSMTALLAPDQSSTITGTTDGLAPPATSVKALPGTGDATLADDHTETMIAAPAPTVAPPMGGDGQASVPAGPQKPVGGAPAVDPQAAKEASFARAKDAIGQQARASMTALRENLASRGALGGGVEQGGMASLLGGGVSDLQDVVTGQAAFDVAGTNDLANRNYEGMLTKRGQDLNLSQSLLSLLGGSGY